MLSTRLQIAMREAGISQAELARACGVKPPSVNGWLSGKSKFLRGENLLSAAKALNVSQAWLATGNGPMHQKPEEQQHAQYSGILPLSSEQPGNVDTEAIATAIDYLLRVSGLDISALGGAKVVMAKLDLAIKKRDPAFAEAIKPRVTDMTLPDPAVPGYPSDEIKEDVKKAS